MKHRRDKVDAAVKASGEVAPVVERLRILEVRGQAVVLDSDLADVYGVITGNFKLGSAWSCQQLRRRFKNERKAIA